MGAFIEMGGGLVPRPPRLIPPVPLPFPAVVKPFDPPGPDVRRRNEDRLEALSASKVSIRRRLGVEPGWSSGGLSMIVIEMARRYATQRQRRRRWERLEKIYIRMQAYWIVEVRVRVKKIAEFSSFWSEIQLAK